jgi:hypothetical protein
MSTSYFPGKPLFPFLFMATVTDMLQDGGYIRHNRQLFSPPPFLFTSTEPGNWTGISFGTVLAFPIAGPVTDAISRCVKKPKSRHEPQYRLYRVIIPFLLCSPGLLLFEYTYIEGSYRSPSIGYATQVTSIVLAPAIMLSYAINSYPYGSAEVVRRFARR